MLYVTGAPPCTNMKTYCKPHTLKTKLLSTLLTVLLLPIQIYYVLYKQYVNLKLDLDSSNLRQFSRDRLRFEPSMGRLIAPKSINLGTTSILDFYM